MSTPFTNVWPTGRTDRFSRSASTRPPAVSTTDGSASERASTTKGRAPVTTPPSAPAGTDTAWAPAARETLVSSRLTPPSRDAVSGRPSRRTVTVAGAHRLKTRGASSPHSVWFSGSAVSFSETTGVARPRSEQLPPASMTAERTPPSGSEPPKSERAVEKTVDGSLPKPSRPPMPSSGAPDRMGRDGSAMFTRYARVSDTT